MYERETPEESIPKTEVFDMAAVVPKSEEHPEPAWKKALRESRADKSLAVDKEELKPSMVAVPQSDEALILQRPAAVEADDTDEDELLPATVRVPESDDAMSTPRRPVAVEVVHGIHSSVPQIDSAQDHQGNDDAEDEDSTKTQRSPRAAA